ncbi:hypothetical protein GPAL_0991 [Glaciecola pallidula DSM 14239 = ACAM 615]|uniref:Uncharacterized protein n=1 Tax=Brumicola pallidula DSM 14239 = ACAM 615 TaxID=1121922 RepID=K6ZX21_9ALTE|nr:hypothetical protein GPAL_0991 [Glaciecola pallidula DSM 14239 = ACAM 615]
MNLITKYLESKILSMAIGLNNQNTVVCCASLLQSMTFVCKEHGASWRWLVYFSCAEVLQPARICPNERRE